MKHIKVLLAVVSALFVLVMVPGAASAGTVTIAAHLSSNKVTQGQVTYVLGTVLPSNGTSRVVVQRGIGGRWTDRQAGVVTAAGTFDIGIRPSQAGIYSLRVRSNGGTVDSKVFYFRVEPSATPPAPTGCPNGTYVNSDGVTVCSPETSPSGPPAGATALCNDGTYSFSLHHSGTCSGHGGVEEWL